MGCPGQRAEFKGRQCPQEAAVSCVGPSNRSVLPSPDPSSDSSEGTGAKLDIPNDVIRGEGHSEAFGF